MFVTKGVKINDKIVFVKNTCAFDSLVQILLTRAIDNTNYSAFIEKSENSLLQFVWVFMMNGVTPDILRKRVQILQNFHNQKVAVRTKERVLSWTMDTWDSIENIVNCTLGSELSVLKTQSCANCKGRTYACSTIAPNHSIL